MISDVNLDLVVEPPRPGLEGRVVLVPVAALPVEPSAPTSKALRTRMPSSFEVVERCHRLAELRRRVISKAPHARL